MSRPLAKIASLTLVSCLAGSLLVGCGRTVFDRPIDTSYDSRTVTGQLDFFEMVAERSAVTNDEGLHGLALFAEGIDPSTSYEERLAYFKEKGWLGSRFDEPANMYMQRGVVAKVLCHILDIDGGLMLHLTNKAPRYANRELIYLQLLPPGTDNQVFTGLEFITVLGRAEDYQILQAVRAAQEAAEDQASDESDGV